MQRRVRRLFALLSWLSVNAFEFRPLFSANSRLVNGNPVDNIPRMPKSLLVALCLLGTLTAADLPSKKYLNLAAIKTMVAGAEAEA